MLENIHWDLRMAGRTDTAELNLLQYHAHDKHCFFRLLLRCRFRILSNYLTAYNAPLELRSKLREHVPWHIIRTSDSFTNPYSRSHSSRCIHRHEVEDVDYWIGSKSIHIEVLEFLRYSRFVLWFWLASGSRNSLNL